jgi:hypothetical protein
MVADILTKSLSKQKYNYFPHGLGIQAYDSKSTPIPPPLCGSTNISCSNSITGVRGKKLTIQLQELEHMLNIN